MQNHYFSIYVATVSRMYSSGSHKQLLPQQLFPTFALMFRNYCSYYWACLITSLSITNFRVQNKDVYNLYDVTTLLCSCVHYTLSRFTLNEHEICTGVELYGNKTYCIEL